jgi:hypothetical protein
MINIDMLVETFCKYRKGTKDGAKALSVTFNCF